MFPTSVSNFKNSWNLNRELTQRVSIMKMKILLLKPTWMKTKPFKSLVFSNLLAREIRMPSKIVRVPRQGLDRLHFTTLHSLNQNNISEASFCGVRLTKEFIEFTSARRDFTKSFSNIDKISSQNWPLRRSKCLVKNHKTFLIIIIIFQKRVWLWLLGVDSEGSRQWLTKNLNEWIPLLCFHYPLLLHTHHKTTTGSM